MFKKLESDLRDAKRPLFLVGGGAGNVPDLPYPTMVTWNGLDKVTPDQSHYAGVVGTYGGPGRNFAVQSCDLLVAVGCRISGRITGGMVDNFAPRAKKWQIDVEPKAEGDWIKWGLDANEFWDGIRKNKSFPLENRQERKKWLWKCQEWTDKYDPVKSEHFEEFHHYGFMRKVSEYIPDNAIITFDTGGSAIMMGHAFRPKKGQRIFSSNGNSPMGFAMCGAMGAWFADKTRPIVCFIGDGGFNMNLQELQTIVNYGINIKIFILNNHCYGNTKLFQRYNYGSRFYACGPDGYNPPDFWAIVKAYGIKWGHIDCWNKFDMVGPLMDRKETWIVDVVHHDFYEYLPRISRFDQDLCDQDPPLPRDEWEANLA
jgi:acetolactate synthase-1/2/3 large subunit